MSHKIPGQSCKINDLFCYLMSSSTVERLDSSDFLPHLLKYKLDKNTFPLFVFLSACFPFNER